VTNPLKTDAEYQRFRAAPTRSPFVDVSGRPLVGGGFSGVFYNLVAPAR